jgi:hypothetical protein
VLHCRPCHVLTDVSLRMEETACGYGDRAAANVMNKQSRTAGRGWSSSLVIGRGWGGKQVTTKHSELQNVNVKLTL